MSDNKTKQAFDTIYEEINKWAINLCPDWETCSMRKIDAAERREIEVRKAFDLIASTLGFERIDALGFKRTN
jgi:hypothetical protein